MLNSFDLSWLCHDTDKLLPANAHSIFLARLARSKTGARGVSTIILSK